MAAIELFFLDVEARMSDEFSWSSDDDELSAMLESYTDDWQSNSDHQNFSDGIMSHLAGMLREQFGGLIDIRVVNDPGFDGDFSPPEGL